MKDVGISVPKCSSVTKLLPLIPRYTQKQFISFYHVYPSAFICRMGIVVSYEKMFSHIPVFKAYQRFPFIDVQIFKQKLVFFRMEFHFFLPFVHTVICFEIISIHNSQVFYSMFIHVSVYSCQVFKMKSFWRSKKKKLQHTRVCQSRLQHTWVCHSLNLFYLNLFLGWLANRLILEYVAVFCLKKLILCYQNLFWMANEQFSCDFGPERQAQFKKDFISIITRIDIIISW